MDLKIRGWSRPKRPLNEAVYSYLTTQHNLTVSKVRFWKRGFKRAPQPSMLGSELGGGRKYWPIRQSRVTNILQHVTFGTRQNASIIVFGN